MKDKIAKVIGPGAPTIIGAVGGRKYKCVHGNSLNRRCRECDAEWRQGFADAIGEDARGNLIYFDIKTGG